MLAEIINLTSSKMHVLPNRVLWIIIIIIINLLITVCIWMTGKIIIIHFASYHICFEIFVAEGTCLYEIISYLPLSHRTHCCFQSAMHSYIRYYQKKKRVMQSMNQKSKKKKIYTYGYHKLVFSEINFNFFYEHHCWILKYLRKPWLYIRTYIYSMLPLNVFVFFVVFFLLYK